MKVKMTIVVETMSFSAIPSLLHELRNLAITETKEGKIVKKDDDRITWSTEYESK